MQKFDVAIVGAGPAGASAAYFLARQGLEVALLDKAKFPRDKTCGDGVGPHAVEMLEKMGLHGWLASGKYHRCDKARLFATDGSYFEAQIPAEDAKYPHFYMVPRLDLDQKVLEAAAGAGAKLFEGHKATELVRDDGRVTGVRAVHDNEALEFAARVVVCADGTSGTFLKCTGIECVKPHAFAIRAYYSNVKGPTDCISVLIDRKIPEGYAWIFPTGNDTANIGLGISRPMLHSRNIDIKALLNWLLKERDTGPVGLRGATPITEIKGAFLRMGYGRHEVISDGVLLVGDAAALISPLSGEGIAYALISGEQAAVAIKSALDKGDTSARGLKHYQDFLARHFFTEHRQGEMIRQSLAFADYKPMNWLLRKGIKHPELAAKFVSVMLSTARPDSLLKPKMLRYYLM